jgi:hypothetical protein
MCSEVPSSRPSASEALECVRGLVLSHDISMSDVPRKPKRRVLVQLRKEGDDYDISMTDLPCVPNEAPVAG